MAGSKSLTTIFVKAETTPGTYSTPAAATDAIAIRVANLSISIDQSFASRDVITSGYNATDKLSSYRRAKISFSVELGASGTAGTAPKWGVCSKAAGQSETITAATRVEYAPISALMGTVSLIGVYDGVQFAARYASCNQKMSMKVNDIGSVDFEFTGLVNSVTAGALAGAVFSNQARAQAVGPTNTTGLSLGAVTYAAGAITGGTAYGMESFNFDTGLDIQDIALTGGLETIGIYGREPKVDFTIDLPAAAKVALIADMDSGTTRAFGLVHGTVAGNKVGFYAPALVIEKVDTVDSGSVLLTKISGTLRPSANGLNDEHKIWTF